MSMRDWYQDVLGSAGGFKVHPMIFVKLFKNNQFSRTIVFLKNFLIWGRIVNSLQRQKRKNKNLFFPKSMVIEPSFQCNLECRECYAPQNKKTMTGEFFDKIITDAEKLGIYRFEIMGGEPVIKEVREIIIPVIRKHKRCYFTICTNCTLMDDDAIKDLKPLKNLTIVLSSEGTKKLTDKRRGKGVYDNFDKTIKRLKKEKMAFALSLTMNAKNWEEQLSDEVFDHYTNNGGFVVYTHLIVDNKKEYLNQNKIDRIKFLKRLQNINKKYNLWLADGTYGKMTNRGVIPRDFYQVCVDPEGNVRSLRFYYKTVIGSLKKETLRNLLANPKMIKFKNEKRKESNHYLDDIINNLKNNKFYVYRYKRSFD